MQDNKRQQEYRLQVRRTMQRFSDQGLAYQDARIVGGIDREECDREIMRREDLRRQDAAASGDRDTLSPQP